MGDHVRRTCIAHVYWNKIRNRHVVLTFVYLAASRFHRGPGSPVVRPARGTRQRRSNSLHRLQPAPGPPDDGALISPEIPIVPIIAATVRSRG